MSGRTLDLSVVIPFLDEEGNVLPLMEELNEVLVGLDRTFEIIAVNDGSRDGTDAELRQACARFRHLRYLRFHERQGQSAAFLAGFHCARGRLVATMDGDGQIDPRDLVAMLKLLDERGVDLVHGWRRDRQDSLVKKASTWVANAVRNRLTHESIADTGCPLKVFRWQVLEHIPPFAGMHRFFITLAHMAHFTSCQMAVSHRPRLHGRSKYGIWNRVFRALRDCLVIRWMQARHVQAQAEEVSCEQGQAARGSEVAEQGSSTAPS